MQLTSYSSDGSGCASVNYTRVRAHTHIAIITVALHQHQQDNRRESNMVKLGSNLVDKMERQPSVEDGFDNIPLITPLEVGQLQQPFPDKVIVKTTAEYQLKEKKRKLYVPSIKKLNINLYDEMSEKLKLTGLIIITLAFLACLLLLVMYKALWYDQLGCPEGFVLQVSTNTLALPILRTFVTLDHKTSLKSLGYVCSNSQKQNSRGSLYTAMTHLNQAKKNIPELSPPWLPVMKDEVNHSEK
ncbi:calcyon neuron-specific vesicular protein [Garra rufa]|uniref:calcyon neuron-specific vesicular protein n=1 Tax=Garra rufa TaxID=137080 RepID=UPI003CCE78CF